jgi:hypothetical protein
VKEAAASFVFEHARPVSRETGSLVWVMSDLLELEVVRVRAFVAPRFPGGSRDNVIAWGSNAASV